ncbi:hypothetical protein [Lentzea albidocapillata]|uniref:Uncharacterized protein n=1 Tax=Lentzea albidocapillata subsp. violacea TaxID=128104 RepID=A0A1G8QM89_9PSEU|nr:hypothetical protein [Lentzea albidocapillata]SDJ05884.1 hypothetical protein SAMN04488074_101398 [Lentzea albidocapillata subsp. violacea]
MQPEFQSSPSSPSRFGKPRHAAQDFAQARLAAETTGLQHQRQAAKRVAEHARDVSDCRDLLSMLGLANLPASTAVSVEGARR